MAHKKKVKTTVVSQKQIGERIFDLWLETNLAKDAHPGQFVAVYPRRESTLLPRPISICETDKKADRLRLVYRVAGKGTAEFSTYGTGDTLEVLGVLGNGFPVERASGKEVFLMGGGIGIPPLLELAKAIGGKKRILLGYRNKELFLEEDLAKYGDVYVATEDGSVGTKGNVMDIIRAHSLKADVIMACGPMPMLRAVKQYAAENGIEAYISLEERMACGVGACLGCVCKTAKEDSHSHVHNARICTEGPVFEAGEVTI
ncbi:MAG: dihydroorotate dehydrogenase electron transfer subunit [Bacteroidales bacterium]|nr:dihydroorotate dehydrogenase electron transfer subunit [Bacteroidales bacterium]MCM1415724.1 dihydroorotate dehydrogenase electron transfer subunit [bacterium]MCM1423678.1 dihydroorotate dehydrogenase electron transfer subunit [bacterium]